MTSTERLAVWLYGTRIAHIERGRDKRLSLHFRDEAFDLFGPDSPILSTSLLVRQERYPNALTRSFFDNLLPEGPARNTIVRALNAHRSDGSKLDDRDIFGLLAEIGRDCAGAIVIQPMEDSEPVARSTSDARPITDDEVAERIRKLPTAPLGIDIREGVRISLAGAQRKLLLTRRQDGGWALPVNGVPSTHIMKPLMADERFPNSVANEFFCMQLAAKAGLRVAPVQSLEFDGQPVLVVERFDRHVVNNVVQRIHQEDSCQALGISADLKYQQDGGPSFQKIAELLSTFGTERDLLELLSLMTFNMAIGNADAHGKNYSMLHLESGDVRLTPAYDLLSTANYPDSDMELAMYVDNVRKVQNIARDSIVDEAATWGLSRWEAGQAVDRMLVQVRDALKSPEELDAFTHELQHFIENRNGRLVVEADSTAAGTPWPSAESTSP
jgi:serine/threonine-protein kinase HipA